MKIALTTSTLQIGGMETVIFALAKGLLEAGHEVEIITTDEQGPWFGRAREVGAQAHFINGLQHRSRAAHARRVSRFLMTRGFDTIINNNSWFVQATLSALPNTVATISVIHNAVEPIVSLACSNEGACDALVAISEATSRMARDRVCAHEKIHLIPNGVAVPGIPPQARSANALKVTYCGRLEHAQKGIFLLPDILGRTLNSGVAVTLEVIGDGPDRDQFARLVAEKGVSAHVRTHGALPHSQTLGLIQQADVLILPSFYEGLPIVLLEAMALGAVPVASLLPGITDFVIKHGISGWLAQPGDAEAFSQALVDLSRDPELRWRMLLAAWETVQDRFSMEKMIHGYLNLLEELKHKPPRQKALPLLALDMVAWKDWIPNPVRQRLGQVRRRLL